MPRRKLLSTQKPCKTKTTKTEQKIMHRVLEIDPILMLLFSFLSFSKLDWGQMFKFQTILTFHSLSLVSKNWHKIYCEKWIPQNMTLMGCLEECCFASWLLSTSFNKLKLYNKGAIFHPQNFRTFPKLKHLTVQGSTIGADWTSMMYLTYFSFSCDALQLRENLHFPDLPRSLTSLKLGSRTELWPRGCVMDFREHHSLSQIKINDWKDCPTEIYWAPNLRALQLRRISFSFSDHFPSSIIELNCPAYVLYFVNLLPNLKILTVVQDHRYPRLSNIKPAHMPQLWKLTFDCFLDFSWFPFFFSPMLQEICFLSFQEIEVLLNFSCESVKKMSFEVNYNTVLQLDQCLCPGLEQLQFTSTWPNLHDIEESFTKFFPKLKRIIRNGMVHWTITQQ